MAASRSTQTRSIRDNCINYTSLRLLFFIMHRLMSTYLSRKVCGRHLGSLGVTITDGGDGQFGSIACIDYYWLFLHPSKRKRRDV